MEHPGEVLSKVIAAMTEEKSVARRRTLANEAHAALRQLLDAKPAETADEAERKGYSRGLLVAIELMTEARREHERPLETANVGRAYTVINGVVNYGQFMCSDAEMRMGREAFAMTRMKKES